MSILKNVNTSIRIITVFLISLCFWGNTFASSGTTEESTTNEIETTPSNETSETTKITEKKEKIKQEISTYIIESYKAQGDKLVKDIDQTLQKNIPDKKDRIEAYDKIQSSLEARRWTNKSSKKISETSKQIIDAFLTHIIESIEKKKQELDQ